MSERIERLVECLDEKKSVLESLITLLDEERSLIENLDAQGVEEKNRQKLCAIERMERSRLSCGEALARVAEELRLPESATLSSVIGALSGPVRERLERSRERLFELSDLLKRVSNLNRDLLRSSLGTINRSLEYLRNSFSVVTTYSEGGRVLNGVSGARFLHGEV